MKPSLVEKLERLSARQDELHALLSDPQLMSDQNRFRELSREAAGLGPVTKCFADWRTTQQGLDTLRDMLHQETDAELRALVQDELRTTEEHVETLSHQLQLLLLPSDPADEGNVFLEIRAGTGGEEAALFAADLARMYSRYAELHHWTTEEISRAESERQGCRELILRIIGKGAYSRLKFESGVHRVQRVPETEAQGRIHTSTCTLAVLPEVSEINAVPLHTADLRIDTFRASGAGGQHVNKTDSAIRITHLPTGTVVECQDERSQHKNKAQAMSLLKAKLLEAERRVQREQQAETRRNLVGSGDRSERVRTYNFPQGRVTDHRIQLTLYRLEAILSGELDCVIDPLISEHQADQLAVQTG